MEALPGEKSLYAEDKRNPGLMGPAGCNRSCEILESELAGDSKVFSLGSVPGLLQAWMLSHPGAAAQLGHAQGVLPDQSLTEHPPSVTSRHFSQLPNISWTSVVNQNGASCWQNPTGKRRVKPRQTPFPEGRALCHLTQTPVHTHSQAMLRRGDPVFSPKH